MRFVVVFLWTLVTGTHICDCALLQTDRSGNMSCIGETVNFTCTIPPASVHAWRISSLGFMEAITLIRPSQSFTAMDSSTIMIVGVLDGAMAMFVSSTLSVTSSAELNGTTVQCFDGNVVPPEPQNTTAMVFGPPSAPGLARPVPVPGGDLMSFNFPITPPTPSECVVNYIITVTNVSSGDSKNITVPASQIDRPILGVFDVCNTRYSFTVIPMTIEGPGQSSSPVYHGIDGGITGLQATLTAITWSAPTGVPMTCFPQYIISLTDDPTVTLTVNDTMASSADLDEAGFPFCDSVNITVTPIVAISGIVLSSRSATATLAGNDPMIGEVTPTITVPSTAQSLRVEVSWEGSEAMNRVVGVGRAVPGERECNISQNITAGVTAVEEELSCGDNGTVVTLCVQYFSSGCSSNVSTGDVAVNVDEVIICQPPPTADLTGPIAGGVVAGVVVIGGGGTVTVIVIVIVFKKKDVDDDDGNGDKKKKKKKKGSGITTVTYHTAGATSTSTAGTAVEMPDHAPGALYANPKDIEHEAVAATGDEYALITSNTRGKNKNNQPEAVAVNVGDTYSVPDKTKKKQNQNQGLVYADVDVANPQRPPPPRSHGHQHQLDNEPVTYATVAM